MNHKVHLWIGKKTLNGNAIDSFSPEESILATE